MSAGVIAGVLLVFLLLGGYLVYALINAEAF
ncbi:TPA: K(+)-transporting ATPase subunit F [Escherichia coli]|nr:K(+)-transporting ATPase subunit F [Escherichia coli]HAI3018814.1 K(+)-transporting ATPase subunit F [Escherichia coli]